MISLATLSIAGAFEQPGGGIQYKFPQTVEWLVQHGYLNEVLN